jgi:5'-nucleotidase
VDIIIGGHSHTILEQPAAVNNVLIAQAGTGTDQIGRFDIVVDDDTNSIAEWQWRLVPVSTATMAPDEGLSRFISSFNDVVERKYATVLCKLAHDHRHQSRTVETEAGNLIADALATMAEVDVAFVGSGSLRKERLAQLVTLGDLRVFYPYDGPLNVCTVSGATLKKAFAGFMHPGNRTGEGECYQVNSLIRAVYDNGARRLVSLSINGEPVRDEGGYRVSLEKFHLENCHKGLQISPDDLKDRRVFSTSVRDLLEEWLRRHQNVSRKVEGRLTYLD